MKEMIIASKNQGKIKEFKDIFGALGMTVKSLYDIEYEPEIEETGTTFEENALIKARTISEAYNCAVLADDSGLEIDALDGRPGVYSARYAGEHGNDGGNIDKVLEELEGVPTPNRTGRFVCVLALVTPGQEDIVVRGTCEGNILDERRGENGFGYDPIFYVPVLGKSMAELKPEEKNAISHRGQAIVKLKEKLGEAHV